MNRRYFRLSTLCVLLALLFALPLTAATPPRVSPMGTVSQIVGVSNVEITYSRPSVRERVIFSELVPYGEVWRTGANEATTLSLEHDATFEGKPVAAGTYALFTVPGKASWSLVLSSQTDLWGAYGRDESKDVLKVELTPQAAPFAEMLTFTFPSVNSADGGSEATVQLHWAEVAVTFRVAFSSDVVVDVARDAVTRALDGADGVDARSATPWLNHLYTQDLALTEAESWAVKLSANAADDYAVQALLARLLAKNGKAAEAVAAAKSALALVPEDASGRVKADSDALRSELAAWTGSN